MIAASHLACDAADRRDRETPARVYAMVPEFAGVSYRSGNRIYEYWLFYPRSVVAYFYVLTPRGKIYAALPVRAD